MVLVIFATAATAITAEHTRCCCAAGAERAASRRARPSGLAAHDRSLCRLRFAKWSLATLVAIVVLLQMVDIFDRGDASSSAACASAYRSLCRASSSRHPEQRYDRGPRRGDDAFCAGPTQEMVRSARPASRNIAVPDALPAAALLSLPSSCCRPGRARSEVALTGWWRAGSPPRTQARGRPLFRIGGEIVRAGRASPDGAGSSS